jgi:hypothetical protein
MLRALGSPPSFAGLLVGFLLALVTQTYAQAGTARLLGDRAALRRVGGYRRIADLRRVLDPFGAVAAVLAGPGWGVTPEIPLRSRGRLAVALLVGPLAVAVLGMLALLGYVAAGGSRFALAAGPGITDVVDGVSVPAGQAFLVSMGLEMLAIAVLALVPLPPLPGWRLLELASTGSLGWQRARHYLVDSNLGILALLVLLILPLGSSRPPLMIILDEVIGSILSGIF